MALTHHYLFDTATGFNDSIASGPLHLTAGSGSIASPGKVNQCLQWAYSGGSNAAQSSSQVLPPYGQPLSIAFWLKATEDFMFPGDYIRNASGFRVRLVAGMGSGDYIAIRYSSMSFTNEAEALFTPVGSLSSTFQHIVVTFDGPPLGGGTGTWKFYANGALVGTTTGVSGGPQTNGNFLIGEGWSGNNYIDDLRIYNSEIDATEVAFIYNSGSGTQAESGGTPGSASGSLPTVTMSGPAGSASGGGGGGTASGSLATVTMSALGVVASTSSSIQLSYCACDAEIGWKQSLPVTGFASAVQGDDAISARVTPIVSGTEANIVFFEQRTLTASSTHTYDLRALTDFLGQPLTLSRVYGISIVMVSGSTTISPGASNPLQWFFKSATANVTVTSGNSFLFAQKDHAIVNSGAKTILVTNPSGLSACVYKIAILGGR